MQRVRGLQGGEKEDVPLVFLRRPTAAPCQVPCAQHWMGTHLLSTSPNFGVREVRVKDCQQVLRAFFTSHHTLPCSLKPAGHGLLTTQPRAVRPHQHLASLWSLGTAGTCQRALGTPRSSCTHAQPAAASARLDQSRLMGCQLPRVG